MSEFTRLYPNCYVFISEGVLGRPCNGTSDCFDRNAICFQSTCQCAQGFSPEGLICISSGE